MLEAIRSARKYTGAAVEDSAAEEHHVDPLDEWPQGHFIEDGLLGDAALVEVAGEEGLEFAGSVDTVASQEYFDADQRGERDARYIQRNNFFDGDLGWIFFF